MRRKTSAFRNSNRDNTSLFVASNSEVTLLIRAEGQTDAGVVAMQFLRDGCFLETSSSADKVPFKLSSINRYSFLKGLRRSKFDLYLPNSKDVVYLNNDCLPLELVDNYGSNEHKPTKHALSVPPRPVFSHGFLLGSAAPTV